jgi:hypothetical protein
MKLDKKYIKCFTQNKSKQLQEAGYKFLYESNGVFYFEDNQNITVKFSDDNSNILKDTKYSLYIPL